MTTMEQCTTDLQLDDAAAIIGLSVYGVQIPDLRVRPGEVVALLGPNGSGKSSVARVVAGELAVTMGSARVLGLDPTGDAAELKGRVGSSIRDMQTLGSLNSYDVLDICAAVRGCTMTHAEELAERLQLDLHRPIGELCAGQLRRLGIVQALMHQPELVVMDEPASDLDDDGRRTLAGLLREVAARGGAVLVTAQSAAEVDNCADRIVTLPGRRIAAAPDPETTQEPSAESSAVPTSAVPTSAAPTVPSRRDLRCRLEAVAQRQHFAGNRRRGRCPPTSSEQHPRCRSG